MNNEFNEVVMASYLSICLGEIQEAMKGILGLLIKPRFQLETFQVLSASANHQVFIFPHLCFMSQYPVLIHSQYKCLL
jgi:hypothetical protein